MAKKKKDITNDFDTWLLEVQRVAKEDQHYSHEEVAGIPEDREYFQRSFDQGLTPVQAVDKHIADD